MRQIWRIVSFTRQLWRSYVAVGIFTILLAIMAQLQPLFTKGAIDQITNLIKGGNVDIKLVVIFAILIFLTDLGQTVLSNIAGYIGDMLSAKLGQNLSERYFEHLLSLPQSYFDQALTGTIINRMNRGIGQIANYMNMLSNNFLQFIFSTVFSLIIVWFYSWQVALLLASLYPIFIWLTTRTSSRWQDYQKDINKEQDIASGRFAEAIGQIKVVKSFLQEKRELLLFGRHYAKAVTITSPQSKYWHSRDVSRRVILNIIFFAIYAYIFVATARGDYSIGTMVLLIQYAALIRIPLFTISFLVDQTQRALANTKDYFEVMDVKPDIQDKPDATTLNISDGTVTFHDVRFGYEDGQDVLKGISFRLQHGTKTALVGESGQGKTTITNLLLRLYDVRDGTITIDGQDISDVSQASLRTAIAVVFQEPALFSGTIRDNIAYGQPDVPFEAVEAAAKAANADEFISKFDKGYDAQIGERGLKLSGGQKQRIAIARALLKDAPILILDEATSSLDSRSERMVQEALERLMKGRTTLIIAHRLSTIQSVDQIVTIDDGQVVESGTPEDLAASGGIYAELLALQNRHSVSTKKKLQAYEIAS